MGLAAYLLVLVHSIDACLPDHVPFSFRGRSGVLFVMGAAVRLASIPFSLPSGALNETQC